MRYTAELLLICWMIMGVVSAATSTAASAATSAKTSAETPEAKSYAASAATSAETSTKPSEAKSYAASVTGSVKAFGMKPARDDSIYKMEKKLNKINGEVILLSQKKQSLEFEIKKLKDLSDELKAESNSYQLFAREGNINNTSWGPADCADLLMSGVTTSGIYNIYPFSCKCSKPMRVYCDMETDGGGWTVFLHRENQTPQVNFNRTWQDYKYGFGNLAGEHWLGNENLHLLTNSRKYSLRMDISTTSDVSSYLLYDTFSIADEINRYKSSVGTRVAESTQGTDCLYYFRGYSFSTYDRDNDGYSGSNCAHAYGSGFWFFNYCYRYSTYSPTSPYGTSMSLSCSSSTISKVKRLQMKIRPAMCEVASKRIGLPHHDCSSGCSAS